MVVSHAPNYRARTSRTTLLCVWVVGARAVRGPEVCARHHAAVSSRWACLAPVRGPGAPARLQRDRPELLDRSLLGVALWSAPGGLSQAVDHDGSRAVRRLEGELRQMDLLAVLLLPCWAARLGCSGMHSGTAGPIAGSGQTRRRRTARVPSGAPRCRELDLERSAVGRVLWHGAWLGPEPAGPGV
jgi:hypothetical protein